MPISNIVFTGHARKELDLWNSEWLAIITYQPPRRRFPGACLRLGSGTFLLFKSGNVVINGVTSLPDLNELRSLLGINLFDVRLSHISGYLKLDRIDLQESKKNFEHSTLEPEIHPGLIFKINKVSVIVYHTGTVIYCGCRSAEHADYIEQLIKGRLVCLS